MVDDVRDLHAQLPLPTSKVQFIGEALGTFVAWPIRLTLPFVAQQQVVHYLLNFFFR